MKYTHIKIFLFQNQVFDRELSIKQGKKENPRELQRTAKPCKDRFYRKQE